MKFNDFHVRNILNLDFQDREYDVLNEEERLEVENY